jgi:hypothetical protein
MRGGAEPNNNNNKFNSLKLFCEYFLTSLVNNKAS